MEDEGAPVSTNRLVRALERQKKRWLHRDGSANVQTRGGYIEGINDAMAIVREFATTREGDDEG